MRVATRRMRAAMRVFGGAYDRRITRTYLDDLRLLGGRLGVVRDLDVWLTLLAADVRRRSKRDRAGLRTLAAAWEADRAARHADLVAVISSPWFVDVVTSLAAFVETPGAASRVVTPRTPNLVRDRVPSVLWADYQAVSAYGVDLDQADVIVLHELRIAAKWLRYTLEFVREPLGPAATDLIRRVVILQDQLGDIHDRHAAASSAVAYAAEAASTDAAPIAIGRFIEDQASRVDRLQRRLGPASRGVMDADYRRRLGRAVARL
jgi:CHAD domain-containing protein